MAKRVGLSQLDQHQLVFGTHKVTLYRRGDTGDSSWFFRIHLKAEDRFFRKSLKTKDKDEAARRAQDELINLLAKLQTGQRILAVSLPDLDKKFRVHCDELVSQDQLSIKTWLNHKSRINHGLQFLKTLYPADVKLSSIDGAKFEGYLKFRSDNAIAKGKTIRRDVVRDELLIIRKMFLWGQKEGICPPKAVPSWDFYVEKQGPKRKRLTQINFRQFMESAYLWAREAGGDKDVYQRRMVLYICVVVSVSGIRSGELFGLKMRDVHQQGKDDCLVHIRAETSKVRRSRQIVIPKMMSKWLEHTRAKEPSDFVFCGFDDPKVSARDIFYHLYKQLRLFLGGKELGWFDLYHCRHWYITTQLLSEQPIHLIAQAAGTSVKEIESTYSHVLTEMTTREFNKRQLQWKPDGSYEIIKKLK